MQDNVVTLLGDWSTTQSDLAKKFETTITEKAQDLESKSLSFAIFPSRYDGWREQAPLLESFLRGQFE
jgi:hypothetical protein